MRTFVSKGRLGLMTAACMVALAACGSSSSSTSAGPSSSSGGKTIDIYSSLPLQGAVNVQTLPMVNGIKLALDQAGGKAGQFKVNYISLDDSTATSASPPATSTSHRRTHAGPRPIRRPSSTSASSTRVVARSRFPSSTGWACPKSARQARTLG